MKIRKGLRKAIKRENYRVSVFGSARVKKSSPLYKEIYLLGQMIGERGMDLVTGGGPGIMEAASEGHKYGSKESKANTIGLGIRLPHEQRINGAIKFYEEFKIFSDRLDNFMLLSNAIIVAPGGIGTILELYYTWQLMQVSHICHIPVILVGKMWPELIEWMEKYPLKNNFIKAKDLHLIFLADDANEAMKVIDKSYDDFKKGRKNFCLNYKEYKIK